MPARCVSAYSDDDGALPPVPTVCVLLGEHQTGSIRVVRGARWRGHKVQPSVGLPKQIALSQEPGNKFMMDTERGRTEIPRGRQTESVDISGMNDE